VILFEIVFNKTLFFIRTGIDEELRNHRRDYPTNFNPMEMVDMIRDNCLRNLETNLLKTNLSLYLINTKDKTKYDFPKLIDDIMKYINRERDNRVLTLIKDDPEQVVISPVNTTLQTAQTIVTKWARFGLVSYLYDRYYK